MQPDKLYFILATIKDVEENDPEVIEHSQTILESTIRTKTIWDAQDYFMHLVFQVKDIPIWNMNKTQIQTLCTFTK